MSGMLLLIPLAVFLTTVLLVYGVYRLMFQQREMVRGRLAHYGMEIGESSFGVLSSGVLRENRLSSIKGMDAILTRWSLGEQTAQDLARAAIPLRVGEYLLVRWLVAIALFAVGTYLSKTLVIGIPLGILGYFLPPLYVKRCEQKRIRKFDDHLVGSVTLMANSLRAGFGLLQGFEAVAREMPSPVSEEFSQVLHEVGVGAAAEEALVNLSQRVRSADLDLVVTAMLIQRTVGGNLAEILDTIASTIRERVRLLREIRTLTAQQRLSGYIIGALPVALLIIISMTNPGYLDMLFTTLVGRIMLAAAVVLEVLGFYITRKIMAIEV